MRLPPFLLIVELDDYWLSGPSAGAENLVLSPRHGEPGAAVDCNLVCRSIARRFSAAKTAFHWRGTPKVTATAYALPGPQKTAAESVVQEAVAQPLRRIGVIGDLLDHGGIVRSHYDYLLVNWLGSK